VATCRLARKCLSNSPGLVDFAARLVNSVLNLPDGQVKFLGNSNHKEAKNQCCLSTNSLGLGKMTFGLVHASYSLRKWQAVKLTFFAP